MESKKPEIVSEDKHIERLLADAFAGEPVHQRILHVTRKYEVTIVDVAGHPEPELSSFATLGLWRTPLTGPKITETERLELVGIFESNKEGCREVLASAAFRTMRTQKYIHPGSVLQDCVHEWYPKASVPHLYFVEASTWTFPQLKPAMMGKLRIHFLEALPISDAEYQYVEEHGGRALEARLLGASASLWDLKRPSAV
jgi:hypothetical protein